MSEKTKVPIPIKRIKRYEYKGKRKFMITHPFDGLVEPIHPTELTKMMTNLMDKVDYKKADYIVGLDAAGIIPSLTASIITGLPLRIAYKAKLDISNKITFKEPESPRPDIYIYNLPKGKKVIVIDDEIRTGRTVYNCIKAIEQSGSQVICVIVPIESTKFNAREMLKKKLGCDLISYTQHEF